MSESDETQPAPTKDGTATVPETVGRFVIGGKLGEGGMGVVFRARDPSLDREVAIKLVHTSHANAAGQDRLLREAQAMARVGHPNVVSVYEVGTHDNAVYIAMELVEGESLGQWLAHTPRGHSEILEKFVQAGRGLAAAHRVGVLHRDFKPANVIVGEDGRARVLDFGLARYAPGDDPIDAVAPESPLASPITHFGELVGTPQYTPPEQFRGEVSAASDQWSLCVALYRALFGVRPFEATSVAELHEILMTKEARLPEVGDVPEGVVAAIMRGLQREPEARWGTVDELIDALESELRPGPATDALAFRRHRRVAAASLGVLSMGVLGVVGLKTDFRFDVGMKAALSLSTFGLVATLTVAVVLRRALQKSTYNRKMMLVFVLVFAVPSVHRALALGRIDDVLFVVETDEVFLAALYLFAAFTVDRWLAWAAATMVSALFVTRQAPALFVPVYSVSLIVTAMLALWFWRDVPRGSLYPGRRGPRCRGCTRKLLSCARQKLRRTPRSHGDCPDRRKERGSGADQHRQRSFPASVVRFCPPILHP